MRPLFDYQQRGFDAGVASLRAGNLGVQLVGPTGMGKTRLGAEFPLRAMAKGRGAQGLWLAHRRELIDQAIESLLEEGFPEDQITTLRGGTSKSYKANRALCVASTQTLLTTDVDLSHIAYVIADECHHYTATAPEWRIAMNRFSGKPIIGLTATPANGSGRSEGGLFDELIVIASVRELIELGRLVESEIIKPDEALKGRFVAQSPVAALQEYAAGSSTLVFCRDVKHAQDTAAEFTQHGIPAACVEGGTTITERKRSIKEFRAGTLQVLTNVYVLTEGTDLPIASTCILARSCGSLSTYVQICGRVLRAYPGKTGALVLDLVGSSLTHGLLDDPREYSLTGEGIRKADGAPAVKQCSQCGHVYVPVSTCPFCGAKAPPPPPVEVKPTKLSPLERDAKATTKERQRYYDFLCRECRKEGHLTGWIYHKFKGRYGKPPAAYGMKESEESKAMGAGKEAA